MKGLTKIRPRWELLPIALFVTLWEAMGRFDLMPGQFFFPPFSSVMVEFYHLVANGVLVDNFLSSLIRVLLGFITGSLVGVSLGIMMGWNEVINK